MTGASERHSRAPYIAAVLLGGTFACGSAAAPVKAPVQAPLSAAPVDAASSIVVVSADGMDPDLAAPWGTGKSWSRTMTGLVVEGHQILVVGWGLRGQQHIRVQKQGAAARSEARAVFADADRGLTLLTVEDPAFWSSVSPAVLSPAVASTGAVKVFHAEPEGRIETTGAALGGLRAWGRAESLHLKVGQVDRKVVAISDVIVNGATVVGAVDSASIDAIVGLPSTTLADFVAASKRPGYRGAAMFGVRWQSLKSPTLREELGLGPSEGGVRVTHVFPLGSASGVLREGDVLLTFEGKKIESDGTYDRLGTGAVSFLAMLSEGRRPGDVVELGIDRAGAKTTVKVTLKEWPGSADLVPFFPEREEGRTYQVEGGLVFENLSVQYLQLFGKDWETIAPRSLLEAYALDRGDAKEAGSHVVVLTRVLADPATLGYQQLHDLVVESVNGVRLRSVEDLRAAFAHPTGAFDVVTFAPGQAVRRIVLDAKDAAAADERLRASYELPKAAQ